MRVASTDSTVVAPLREWRVTPVAGSRSAMAVRRSLTTNKPDDPLSATVSTMSMSQSTMRLSTISSAGTA